MRPENETEGNILYALYAQAHGNYTIALEYALKAYAKRKINWTLWRILRDCYYALGDMKRAALFAAKADNFYNEPVNLDLPKTELEAILAAMSLGMGNGLYAPLVNCRLRLDGHGMTGERSIFAGEFLPDFDGREEYRLFSAAYVEQELLDDKWRVMSALRQHPDLYISRGDFTYDLIKLADKGQKCIVETENDVVVVGIVGKAVHQQVDFKSKGVNAAAYLGKWVNSFFRIEETTEIVSNEGLLCTPPIVMKHSPRRCKAVINVLLDGLCWRAVQERNYELVPNLLDFFYQGVIFNNHYSVSEYTYPSVATIETGLYPYHSQIFNDRIYHTINTENLSISEQMHRLGYYCVNIMGDGAGTYNGIMRGYDRMLVNCDGNTPLHIGVQRTLNQLEAFAETDQFIFLHVGNSHLWSAHDFQLPLATQTRLSLQQRSLKEEEQKTSVHLPKKDIYVHWNEQGIKDCDNNIARLLHYLTSNYSEDEYLLTVYSDHGSPIYDNSPYLLSEHQNSAAFMMRGNGVPAVGFSEELTSAIDLYQVWGKCLGFAANKADGNLPAVFGGKAREYVVSMSMFSPSPYRICLRTREYECQAASKGCLDEDGRADLTEMQVDIYRRDNGDRVENPDVKEYFLRILQQETRELDDFGTQWPDMRAARPEWFAERN